MLLPLLLNNLLTDGGVLVIPDVEILTLNELAPTVLTDITIIPSVEILTLSELAPTILTGGASLRRWLSLRIGIRSQI